MAAPKFGPKQTEKLHPRDVGIGGGPPHGGGKDRKEDDTGELGQHATTEGRKPKVVRDIENVEKPGAGAKVVGQTNQDDKRGGEGTGHKEGAHAWHESENRHGGHDGSMGGLGKHGRHESLKGHEHEGHEHTSKDR